MQLVACVYYYPPSPHAQIPPQPISGTAPFAGIIPTDPLTYRQESDINSINNVLFFAFNFIVLLHEFFFTEW